MNLLESHWYQSKLTFLTMCLLPVSWLFRVIVFLRRLCYQLKLKKSVKFAVPVIVVGNISVGGTGKTPFVIWLAELLRQQGYTPGIVTRGVGGQSQKHPVLISAHSDVKLVGDEAVLLAKRTNCPVVVCIDRVAAVTELLKNTKCNIVISDDGLQHYRLQRDMEIVMIDAMRGLGNQQLLPAGPLREPVSRLKSVSAIIETVVNVEQKPRYSGFSMLLQGDVLVSVKDSTVKMPISSFAHQRVHAVAAIGNPERFFTMLRAKGFDIIEHIFPDHYLFTAKDLCFSDTLPVVMTEKDAVKCSGLVDEKFWTVPVQAEINSDFVLHVVPRLDRGIQHWVPRSSRGTTI